MTDQQLRAQLWLHVLFNNPAGPDLLERGQLDACTDAMVRELKRLEMWPGTEVLAK